MQEREKETQITPAPADPTSQPLQLVTLPEVDAQDDDPDTIFINAVAEIDTQPLPRYKMILRWQDVLQSVFCLCFIVGSIAGIVYQLITYPKTLVILYAQEKTATLTTTLAIPIRTLAPVTLTRQLTTSTTGYGHQDARAASGTLTFYNGSSTPQYMPIGSVFTGSDGMKVTTVQSTTVPAANLPAIGSMPVLATALLPGDQGNIAAFDVDSALSPVLKVRNEAPFTNGRDARDYHAVARRDLDTLTTTTLQIVNQALPQAFTLRPGEALQTTSCTTNTAADHAIGQEAQMVTVKTIKTCSAVAYNSRQLTRQATVAFTQTKPAAHYHIVGNIQTTLQSVSPLFVTLSGKWVYTFSPEYEQFLAEKIAEDTPGKARKYLLSTGVISQASVPDTLPPAMYINFLVLVGK